MNEQPKQRVSLIVSMALDRGMDPKVFQRVVFDTCMPAKVAVTTEQFAAFLLMARSLDLDPIAREIYAAPAKRGQGIMTIVGVDGWLKIINRHPQFDGMAFDYHWREGAQRRLDAVTCKIYRKDRGHPIEVTEYLHECFQDTEAWRTREVRMLRHKALIQCARYSFSISNVMDPDEYSKWSGTDHEEPSFDEALPKVIQPAPRAAPEKPAEPVVIPPPPSDEPPPDPLDEPWRGDEVTDPRPAGPGMVSEWKERIAAASYHEAYDLFEKEIYPALEDGKITRAVLDELQDLVLKKGGWGR
jgi:phage recombination protein Bet